MNCTCHDVASALRAALEGREHRCATAEATEPQQALAATEPAPSGQNFALNDHEAITAAILGGPSTPAA